MPRIKGWIKQKSGGLTHYGNRPISGSVTYIHKSGKVQIDIYHNPYDNLWYVDIWKYAIPPISRKFKRKTKKEAIKFAINYMKKHLNG